MTAARRRVVVTGIGILSAVGIGRRAYWSGLQSARSPVRRIDRFDPGSFRSQVAAQIDTFDPLDHMDRRAAKSLDRFSQFGLAAGRMAMDDARLVPGADGAPAGEDVGIYIGSALGGIAFAEMQHERYLAKRIRSVSPMLALAVFGGAAPANLGIALGVRGPILSTANSCAAGAVAIGEAVDAIRQGTIDAAVAGGVECPLSPLAFGAFDVIRALSQRHNDTPARASRPFDQGRDGFVMGEGAGLLVLEALDVAARRDADSYAEVLGYGATSDANHMVQPLADGREAARAVTIALADAEASTIRDRLHQRPRQLDSDRRCGRGTRARPGARVPRVSCAGEWDEGTYGASAGGDRRDRGGLVRVGHPRWVGTRHRQPRDARRGDRLAAAWAPQ